METAIAALLALALVLICVAAHYEALRRLSCGPPRRLGDHRIAVLAAILGVITAHGAETLVFAAGYWGAEHVLALGRLHRPHAGVMPYLYFSIETYTTQGVSDISATGGLRLMAAIEPLVGLILIGWSTSFTFLVMRRYWRVAATAPRGRPRRGHSAPLTRL